MQVDSYSPRGPSLNCDFAGSITISHDTFAARSYLSTLPYVDPENIAVVGWSMGGTAALKIIDGYFAVAFYPQGYPVYKPDTPLLILIGEKDEICKSLSSILLAAADATERTRDFLVKHLATR